ncbi:MAG TPA: (d)CMP kinase [Nitrospirota bacterium]|nr:(d)CMP kinase [Nitrospirota bacterium]
MDMAKKNGLVIAIDGPSGAGKSTTARLLAERLGYIYIDTGAMYRSIGWKAKREGIDPEDEEGLADLCARTVVTIKKDNKDPKIFVDGIDVSGEIRTPDMGMMASAVSKSPAVRARLLTLQRELGKSGGVVMDGRDIGTVVFPEADMKFYLDASVEERGRRRFVELKAKGMDVDRARITQEIRDRDRQDSGRKIAPLRQADDALLIDSSEMSIDDVLDRMISEIAKVR